MDTQSDRVVRQDEGRKVPVAIKRKPVTRKDSVRHG